MAITDRLPEMGRRQHYAMAAELSPNEMSQIVGGKPTKNAVVLRHGLIEFGIDQDGVKFLTVSSEQGPKRFGSKTVVAYDGDKACLIEEIVVQGRPTLTFDGQVIAWEEKKAYQVETITDKDVSFSKKDASYIPGRMAIAWSEVHKKIS